MATLTDQQVEYISNDIRAHGIRLEDLRDNLLDHICILVERGLEDGGIFEELYAAIIPTFYKEQLHELEEEALFLASLQGPRLLLTRSRFFQLLFGLFGAPYLLFFLLCLFHLQPAYDTPALSAFRWMLVFSVWPLVSLLVVYFTPDRLDPLVPRHAKVLLGLRPFIRVLPG
jgi:hypothetical protein